MLITLCISELFSTLRGNSIHNAECRSKGNLGLTGVSKDKRDLLHGDWSRSGGDVEMESLPNGVRNVQVQRARDSLVSGGI